MPALYSYSSIQQNYFKVMERIQAAARRSGRGADAVRLVVVTKTQPLEAIEAVIAAGATCLGENYAEEAIPKIEAAPGHVSWHMIGHVQSRKASLVCQYFDYLHSLDSLKLAARLDRFAAEMGVRLPALIECNLAGEATKYGFPIWQEGTWEAYLEEIRQITAFQHLAVCGLMGMAPYFSEPEPARPYFRRLRQFQAFLYQRIPQVDWRELSMGMSGDFEVAIEEGATWVRIGTSIFGPRKYE